MNDMTAIPIRRTSSDVDEFLRRSDEVHAAQRKKVLDLEQAHQVKMTELKNTYARRLNDIAAEGAEALRKEERRHEAEMSAENSKLEAIGRLRNG
jgi:hypothetical protein